MISANHKQPPQKVVLVMLHEHHYGQELLACSAVLLLFSIQCLASKGNGYFFSILHLTQSSTNGLVWCIRIQDKEVSWIWVPQNWWTCHDPFQLLKSFLVFFLPSPVHSQSCQLVQRCTHSGQSLNEPSVVVQEPKKLLQLLLELGCRPLFHSPDMLIGHMHSIPGG